MPLEKGKDGIYLLGACCLAHTLLAHFISANNSGSGASYCTKKEIEIEKNQVTCPQRYCHKVGEMAVRFQSVAFSHHVPHPTHPEAESQEVQGNGGHSGVTGSGDSG